MSDIFVLLPEMLQNVFADNCVAVVFLVAVVANLALPKTISIDGAELAGEAEQQLEDSRLEGDDETDADASGDGLDGSNGKRHAALG